MGVERLLVLVHQHNSNAGLRFEVRNSMSAHTYWPYDEVCLDTSMPGGHITLKTPWLQASTSKDFFNADALKTLSAKLGQRSLTADDLGLVNDFFQHFHQYPVAYILPIPKTDLALDKHSLVDHSLVHCQLEEALLNIFKADSESDPGFPKEELGNLLGLLPRRHWEWDAEAALSFASIHDLVHPESLLSVARRYHLLEIINNDKGSEIFRNIEMLAPEEFKTALCRLIRQNHYITEKCQEALEPALARAGQAAVLVEDFMKEEKGHDKILSKALHHIGAHPENIEVSLHTKFLMHLLKFIATRNFLAFSMAISAFERNNFEEVDPIAHLLIKAGYNKSAEFINLHMKINDHGNHDNIAEKFLSFMDLCPRDYALEALRLMEILSLLMCSISKSASIKPNNFGNNPA